jgi:hypothetical protein
MNNLKTLLSLCDYSGLWSRPYLNAGYSVIRVDVKNGQDIRLLEFLSEEIYGILAAPPCTHLAVSGARWWKDKGESALLDALSIADACMRASLLYNPKFWVLENPVGRLRRYYGPPKFIFHPYQYAGLADNPSEEAYTKRTLLWGNFIIPSTELVGDVSISPILGSKMHLLPPSADRAALRSLTPTGFAKAFFLANQ